MPHYVPPVRDTHFVLEHVLRLDTYRDLPGFDRAPADVVAQVLEEGGHFAAEILFPLNGIGDREGCAWHADGRVTTPGGFRDAYARFVAGGWSAVSVPARFGGQGLPHVVAMAVKEYAVAANMAFAMYPGLTGGAIGALMAAGSPALQATWLPKLVSGEWTGTMNLTEPQCGTDLGRIATRAVPNGDGSWSITGTKIFVSSGEHDLTENIVHIVLARTPGSPAGTRGLSLFVVPKFLVGADGRPGARNAVTCRSIERKMGIHANATCTLDHDGATGWLIGEEARGLRPMFVMVNAARLNVGLQGVAVGDAAYQRAARHAAGHRQGGALIAHPDVRRMLMEGKALTEGLRALGLWLALQVDVSRGSPDPDDRLHAADLLALLTPVFKGFATDSGYRVATDAQQVHGGYGYIADAGIDQHVRDVRAAMIYEGANGVQAMDLVTRKLPADGGRAVRTFLELVGREVAATREVEATAFVARALGAALADLDMATSWLTKVDDPDHAAAGAYHYMTAMGIVATGWMWLRMLRAAADRLAAGDADTAFLQAKRVTGRFYAERILPDASALCRKLVRGADSVMALPPAMFTTP